MNPCPVKKAHYENGLAPFYSGSTEHKRTIQIKYPDPISGLKLNV